MKLSVLISTIDGGINNIENILLEKRKDVEYVVSHQYTDEKYWYIPRALLRDDVLVSQIPGKGLSKSRNNAIKHATGDIGLIADDDVLYQPRYFDKILDMYRKHKIDIACFKIKTFDGEPEYKNYPNQEMDISNFIQYYPSSIEITFDINSIKNNSIIFDQRFGLGAKFIGGEETLFLLDAIQEGLTVKFFPIYVVEHSFESSVRSLKKFDINRIKRNAALDYRINGLISLPKAFLGTIKHFRTLLKHRINPMFYAYHRISTVLYMLFSKKSKFS